MIVALFAACAKKEDAPKVATGDPDEGGQIAQGAASATETAPAKAEPVATPPPPPVSHGAGTGHSGPNEYAVGATRLPGRPVIVPQVRLGDGKLDGKLPIEVVRRFVRQHIAEYRYCYEQLLGTKPDAKGEVVIHFVIAPTGAVVSAEASKHFDDGVDKCVTERIKALEFPKPEAGTVDVHLPLDFSTQ